MTRETRTLRSLFPDPKPPQRKNFIKENVRSLRKMEQLFHIDNKSAKDLKLPILRQTRTSGKSNRTCDSQTTDRNKDLREAEEYIANGMSKLLSHNTFHKDENNRKKSAPVFSTKKTSSKKLSRPSVNGSVTRKSHCGKSQTDHKSKINQKLKAHSDGDIAHEKFNEDNNECVNTKCKNQAVQTLDTTDIDSLYSEGVIRYPSGKTKEKSNLSDRGDAQISECNDSCTKNNCENSLDDCTDHVKSNKERISLASKLASQLSSSAPPPSYRVGVVPKYLKERKEALEKEKLEKAAAKHTDCPSGHIPLPDNERKETLNMLKKNYQEYVNELNMLPIRTDTLRSQKRKMEIEKQLTKLEEAIKVFSRPKVFVKVDS